MDVSSIGPGADFVEEIERVLANCRVCVSLIGPSWLTLPDDDGVPRLTKPDDVVRLELRLALGRQDVTVIPALVSGAKMPQASNLPEDLRGLARRTAIELSDTRWAFDCHRLCATIDKVAGLTNSESAESRVLEPLSASEVPVQPSAADPLDRLRLMRQDWNLLGTRLDEPTLVRPITVDLGFDWVPQVSADEASGNGDLDAGFGLLLTIRRRHIFSAYGVTPPGVLFRAVRDLPSDTYVIMSNEVPLVSGRMPPNKRFCPAAPNVLAKSGIVAEESVNPLDHRAGSLVQEGMWEAVVAHGYDLWNRAYYLVAHLERVITDNLAEFLDIQGTYDLLFEKAPDIVAGVEETGNLPRIKAVMTALIREGVPVSDVAGIASCVQDELAHGGHLADAIARIRLLPALRSRLPGNSDGNTLVQPSSAFLGVFRKGIAWGDDCAFLVLDSGMADAISKALRKIQGAWKNAVLVVDDTSIRLFLRLLVEGEFPEMPVLARQELIPSLRAQPCQIIDL
jgi:hypothetical protein